MTDHTKQSRIMGEMRNAILDAIGACAEKHHGGLEDATFLGALNWVLADFMIAADIPPDDAYLARLNKTIEMVRLTHDMEVNESIH
jgi:hypothetical protein